MGAPVKWKHRSAELERLRAKHGHRRTVQTMPDLSVRRTHPSLSDGFAPVRGKKAPNALPDGILVGNPHKQGLQVMPISELEWAGGKKS